MSHSIYISALHSRCYLHTLHFLQRKISVACLACLPARTAHFCMALAVCMPGRAAEYGWAASKGSLGCPCPCPTADAALTAPRGGFHFTFHSPPPPPPPPHPLSPLHCCMGRLRLRVGGVRDGYSRQAILANAWPACATATKDEVDLPKSN